MSYSDNAFLRIIIMVNKTIMIKPLGEYDIYYLPRLENAATYPTTINKFWEVACARI